MNEKNHSIYKKLHLLSLLIGVLTIALPIIFWSRIPDRIPMHYNGAGVVDNWSDKSSLILLFFVVFMMMGLMSICVYFIKTTMESKYTANYEKSSMEVVYPAIIIMNLMIQIMLAYMTFCVATCRTLGVWFLPVFLVGIFAPIFFMIYKSAKVQTPNKAQNAYYKEVENSQQGVVYRSKVDWWLGGLLLGTVLMVVWFTIDPLFHGELPKWYMVFTTVLTVAIILPLFAMKYVMYSDHLLISMNIYGKARIRYQDIVKMEKTLNPLSSAALSLKRLQIDYVEKGTHQMILISPKDRDKFMEEVERRKQK